MQIQFTRKIKAAIFFFTLFAVIFANPAIVSRLTTFTDGTILTASDLNSEFNNLVNTINNLDNDNLSSTANISASKISAAIDGSGITRDGGTGALSVNPDGVGIEISGDAVQLKNNGVTDAKLRQSAALSVIGRSANSTGNVADIAAGTDGHVLRRSGTSLGFGTIVSAGIEDGTIATADLANGSVTQAKRASLGQQISASGSLGTSSTSPVDVTNLSVTITTTGRPVYLLLISDGGPSLCTINTTRASGTSAYAIVTLVRDSTTISYNESGATIGGATSVSTTAPGSSINFVDVPSAGTYTYKVQLYTFASTSVNITACKLAAFEL